MIKQLIKLGTYTLPVFIAGLLLIRIVVSNSLASFGENMRQIDLRIVRLSEENELLSQQVASRSSLVAIGERAAEFGFVEPTKNQIITMGQDQFPVALKQ